MPGGRNLNPEEAQQLGRLWHGLQTLVAENYGAGRLLREDQDAFWIQRILDEQLVWPEDGDLIQGLGIALGEAVIARSPDWRWTIDEANDSRFCLEQLTTHKTVDVIARVSQAVAGTTKFDVQQTYAELTGR